MRPDGSLRRSIERPGTEEATIRAPDKGKVRFAPVLALLLAAVPAGAAEPLAGMPFHFEGAIEGPAETFVGGGIPPNAEVTGARLRVETEGRFLLDARGGISGEAHNRNRYDPGTGPNCFLRTPDQPLLATVAVIGHWDASGARLTATSAVATSKSCHGAAGSAMRPLPAWLERGFVVGLRWDPAGAALTLAADGGWSGRLRAAPACPTRRTPEAVPVAWDLRVAMVDRVDHTKSARELAALVGAPRPLNGLTTATANGSVSLPLEASAPAFGTGWCWTIPPGAAAAQFAMTLRIYIGTQHPAGSCTYRVVERHERAHVELYRAIGADYGAKLAAALGQAGLPAPGQAWWAASREEAEARLRVLVQRAMAPVFAEFAVEAPRRQEALHTPERQARERQACPGQWPTGGP